VSQLSPHSIYIEALLLVEGDTITMIGAMVIGAMVIVAHQVPGDVHRVRVTGSTTGTKGVEDIVTRCVARNDSNISEKSKL